MILYAGESINGMSKDWALEADTAFVVSVSKLAGHDPRDRFGFRFADKSIIKQRLRCRHGTFLVSSG